MRDRSARDTPPLATGWRGARAMVAVLVLGGSGAARGCDPPAVEPVGVPGPCAAVVVHDARDRPRLICDRALVALLAGACRPRGPIHRGDRLRLEPAGGRCHVAVEPLSAAHRLRLGLRLDVNDASAADLAQVKGIGPRTANRIVEGRPWASVDALDAVWGVGPARLARIAPRLRASPRPRLWPSRPRHAASSPRTP